MNKSLILVSKTPIVIKIFKLVCKKLGIDFDVLKETQIDHKVDITIVDNIVRAVPLMVEMARAKPKWEEFDNKANLAESMHLMRNHLEED